MKKNLGDLAKIFRCTLPRDLAERPREPIYWKRGPIPVWYNISLDDIDPDTGFIRENDLVAVKPREAPGAYAIEPTDILFCFQGVSSRTGQVAMLLHELAAIPGRTLGIIRPHGCDPVWLYYRLREIDIEKELCPQISGRKTFLHFSRIRQMELEMPTDEEVGKINQIHQRIVKNYLGWTGELQKEQNRLKEIFYAHKKK